MCENKKIKVLIADDHVLFRNGIMSLFVDDEDLRFIGEAANGEDLIEKYFALKPDLILTDLAMPVLTGVQAVTAIREEDPQAKALFLTMFDDETHVYEMLCAGAVGYVHKDTLKEDLKSAILRSAAGEQFFGDLWTDDKLAALKKRHDLLNRNKKQSNILTKREVQVLDYVGRGLTTAEIASEINISKRTVDAHRSNLCHKLNLKTLPELIKYALDYKNKI